MNGESVSLLQYHGLDHFIFSIFIIIWNCKWLCINVRLWFKNSASGENTEAEIALIEIISITARLNTFVKKANLLMERIFQLFWTSTVKLKPEIIELSDLRRSLSYSHLPCIVDSSTACMYCIKRIYHWNCLGDKTRNITEKVSLTIDICCM